MYIPLFQMALWVLILLPLFAVVESQSTTNAMNQTDLQAAIGDMRAKSYHGFVILLKILNGTNNSLQTTDITFLMPNDENLSEASISTENLHEFILSHSIPTPLVYNNLLHFPNGTLVPSSLPGRMLSITNAGKAGLFLNNARIVSSNVCMSSLIKCHGVSSEVAFNNDLSTPLNTAKDIHAPPSKVSPKIHALEKSSSPSVHPKRTRPLH